MSWNNVKGVSSAQIWTDNPDMTQAYLFANGNHQVKLTIGISLTLNEAAQPGPTEDEVKTALSLINFETGAGLSFLKTGNKGGYAYVYQPNTPEKVKSIEATSDSSAYQYEFDYYLSSDSTINANYASEIVALMLSYTDASGNKIEYYTASGSKSQSYVAITIYPPKKYGIADSASTPVIISKKDDKLTYTNTSGEIPSNETVSAWSLKIDNGYFRIVSLKSSTSVRSPNPFTRHATDVSKSGAGYYPIWRTYEAFLPSENRVNQGSTSYDTNLSITYSDYDYTYLTLTAKVYQEPNEIIFIHFSGDIDDSGSSSGFINDIGTASLCVVDQFGNESNIVVSESSSGLSIDNVT